MGNTLQLNDNIVSIRLNLLHLSCLFIFFLPLTLKWIIFPLYYTLKLTILTVLLTLYFFYLLPQLVFITHSSSNFLIFIRSSHSKLQLKVFYIKNVIFSIHSPHKIHFSYLFSIIFTLVGKDIVPFIIPLLISLTHFPYTALQNDLSKLPSHFYPNDLSLLLIVYYISEF